MNKFRIYWSFAQGYLFPLWVIDALFTWFMVQHGLSVLTPMIFLLSFVLLLMYGWSLNFRKHQYYYYANLGIGKNSLWTFIVCITAVLGLFSVYLGFRLHQL